ncbi:STK17B family protein [Megaselia abdita]
MFSDGIFPIGDGLLDIDEKRLDGLIFKDDINDLYDVEQTPFARGKFAAVRRAIHKKSGLNFAAKFLKRRRRAQSSDKEIKHEIAVLMLCSGSDNIVKLNAVHETRFDTALLLDLATGGELQTFLDNEGSLTEAHTRLCMREVLKAIQFLHKRSIAHLDLKPQNILLNGERIEDGLKLCDFGISRVVENGSKVREILGTPDYVAPEVLQYEPLSLKTDIWSVGVLAYVLLTGFTPFGGDSKQETFLNISQCALSFPDDLFDGISNHALDFIKCTLRIKPHDRLSATECLEHPWLSDDCTVSRQYLNISSTTTSKVATSDETATSIKSTTTNSNSNTTITANNTNGQYSDDDANDTVEEQSNDEEEEIKLLSRQLIYTRRLIESCDSNKENIKSTTNTVSSATAQSPQQPPTVVTSVNICLFPDAPTTPKVVRKSPSTETSPTSVKALVKKFQLECNENKPTTVDTVDSSTTTQTPSTYKTTCVFCLSCGGPGCRHSGTAIHHPTKTTSGVVAPPGMDQGIIC